jgi:hypothetical protein
MADSNRSVIAVQRAFLNFKGIQVQQATAMKGVRVPGLTGENPNGFKFSAAWENSGTTPAVGVLSYFRIDEVPDEQVATFPFTPEREMAFAKTVMGPRGTGGSGDVFKALDFWKPINGKKNIYFWGWKIYRDTFPKTPVHVTEFCSGLVGVFRNMPLEAGNKVVPANAPWSFTFNDCEGRHNCADEDCEDYAAIELIAETHSAQSPPKNR